MPRTDNVECVTCVVTYIGYMEGYYISHISTVAVIVLRGIKTFVLCWKTCACLVSSGCLLNGYIIISKQAMSESPDESTIMNEVSISVCLSIIVSGSIRYKGTTIIRNGQIKQQ